ncbi:hypothetical protein V490_07400 [Pseudogymnoascus sp. VKM F-3557]|nr:hypothetical protein V490_07400 [Pseudogymnoascus sp. VKM F-3557]
MWHEARTGRHIGLSMEMIVTDVQFSAFSSTIVFSGIAAVIISAQHRQVQASAMKIASHEVPFYQLSFKMKVISVFTALILAIFANVVYSAAIDNSLSSRDVNVTEAADFKEFGDVVAYALPDGRRKIDFYTNGVLDGSAIETDDGATFFEADGTEVDLNDVDEKLLKRVSKWRLAIKFAKLIAKYGKKAWNYIYCVGTSAMWRCGDEYLGCASSGIPPWKCIEGIVCVGSAAKGC